VQAVFAHGPVDRGQVVEDILLNVAQEPALLDLVSARAMPRIPVPLA
jgi:hypothetical protein